MRKTIAIVGGGYKPFTKGHYMVIEQAADFADEVHVFVSTNDRKRTGQLPVLWNGQMEVIWKQFLEKAMPNNVSVHYVSNPNRGMYEFLEMADRDDMNHNTYVIFGGSDDIPKYFPDKSLLKYVPRLMANDQIERKTFQRTEGGLDDVASVSGTKMRNAVVRGDVAEFTSGLPAPVQRYGQEIFDILAKTVDQIKQPRAKKKKKSKKK